MLDPTIKVAPKLLSPPSLSSRHISGVRAPVQVSLCFCAHDEFADFFGDLKLTLPKPKQGQRVRLVLASGAELEGIYNNGPEPTTCRLSMVQQKKLPNSADTANGPSRREQPNMTIQRKDIADARAVAGNNGKNDGKAPNGASQTRRGMALYFQFPR